MALNTTWPLTSDGAGAVTFTANEWRTFLTELWDEGILGSGSFAVSERAAGANMKLDIAGGVGVLTGDDASNQGNYLVRHDANSTEAVTISTADASNPRIDLVGIQLKDPSEGGAAGRESVFAVEAGTAAASPSAPATPDSFLLLARVVVPAAATSITDSDITDLRSHATLAQAYVDTAQIVADAITNAKLRDSSALSVIGRSANSSGDPADIAAGTDHHVLRRSGSSLGFGLITEDNLDAGVLSTTSWSNVAYGSSIDAPNTGQRMKWKVIGNVLFLSGGLRNTGGDRGAAVIGSIGGAGHPSAEQVSGNLVMKTNGDIETTGSISIGETFRLHDIFVLS